MRLSVGTDWSGRFGSGSAQGFDRNDFELTTTAHKSNAAIKPAKFTGHVESSQVNVTKQQPLADLERRRQDAVEKGALGVRFILVAPVMPPLHSRRACSDARGSLTWPINSRQRMAAQIRVR